MAADVISIEAAKRASLNLTEEGQGTRALHQTVVAYRNNRRSGTACTKRRGEVSGSGKKLWKQKGTGNARMGSRRSPIWRGGAVSWGPRPRDYSQKINKKVKQLALRTALTGRINDAAMLRVDSFAVADGKTKSFVAAVRAITDAKKVLIIGNFDEVTLRAARNVAWVQMTRSEDVNAEHLLNYAKVVVTADALEVLARRTATN
jgi:large subunit ribosomal protein L4